jgi:hypothetical protein
MFNVDRTMKTKHETDGNGKANPWSELLRLTDEVHREAETLARKKDTAKLLEATGWLGRALELERRYQGLLAHAERLIFERREPQSPNQIEDLPLEREAVRRKAVEAVNSTRPGGKARADECREVYVAREKKQGNLLNRIRRGYYSNAAGLTLGITYSSEDKRKTCPWFLNLQDGYFQEAVLLCEVTPESVQVVHLPESFFDHYARQMSRDRKGQVKFNVARRNGQFFLQVPDPVGWIPVAEYVEGKPLICPHKEFD